MIFSNFVLFVRCMICSQVYGQYNKDKIVTERISPTHSRSALLSLVLGDKEYVDS